MLTVVSCISKVTGHAVSNVGVLDPGLLANKIHHAKTFLLLLECLAKAKLNMSLYISGEQEVLKTK